MNLISIENIAKSYSEKTLLSNISLGINEGDKIGVIGINGTGKSTLLKIIAGVENSDQGRIIRANSMSMEYLPQNPEFNTEVTVLEQVFKGSSELMELIRQYEAALQNKDTTDDKITELTHRMDIQNAWNVESEAKSILTKLGISDFNAKVGTLSGGQRKRIALAGALINPCDLLILDEPTNHLDNDTIDWLEQYLNKRKGALIMITHDRYFLDRVVNEIIELDSGCLYTYKGNYSDFLEKKLERDDMQTASNKKKQSLFKKELAWIRKGAKARTTKQKARIDRFDNLSDQIVGTNSERFEISVASSRLGKKVIELEDVSKSFGDKRVLDNFTYIILRNDRIGVVGPNGSGKSTLLNMICDNLKPDSGHIYTGETVKVGVFSQETYHMDNNLRVIEYIREGAEYLTTAEDEKISASQMLERFLFQPTQQWTPISKLSGGEKRRLYLLRVLMESPNVLLLDEPTNDLDIETLTILEDYLESFPGAVIAVSHDRYFLDRMSEKIFSFEEQGRVVQYTGNYSDYQGYRKNEEASNLTKLNTDKIRQVIGKNEEAICNGENAYEKRKEKALKFTYKEQREYDEIDLVISELEERISEIENKMSKTTVDYTLLQEQVKDKKDLEDQLDMKMERWVYLNEIAEKINEAKDINRI